jgi:hypothetical protein
MRKLFVVVEWMEKEKENTSHKCFIATVNKLSLRLSGAI